MKCLRLTDGDGVICRESEPRLESGINFTRHFALALLLAGALRAKPWPENYDAPPARWSETENLDGYVYQTRSYTIACKQALRPARVDAIATMAESVGEVLELFPLQLLPHAKPPADGDRRRHVVRILSTQKEYLAAGGAPGTVGIFNGRNGQVMVSLQMLIEPKGPRSNLEPRQRYRLLVHELVHQAMGRRNAELPTWFSEGIAEYLAAMQFAPGRYKFENNSRAIINHLHTVWAHDKRRRITIPNVDALAKISAGGWAADNRVNKDDAYAKYAGAMLLTHYFMELASRGRGGLQEYLAAEPEAVAVPGRPGQYRLRPLDQAVLWRERPPAMVQRGLASYWKTQGLELRFEPLRRIETGTRPAPDR